MTRSIPKPEIKAIPVEEIINIPPFRFDAELRDYWKKWFFAEMYNNTIRPGSLK